MKHGSKKLRNQFISILLICVVIMSTTPFSYGAYLPVYNNDAVRLHRMGLFLGTSNGFELEKPCDRLQGAILFIRLVGEEKETLATPKLSPFKDVTQSWAIPYVGQMYAQGYSIGTSQTTYGTGAMSGNEFATYILRALGYSENDGDFIWHSALSKLVELGIISQRDFVLIGKGPFYRDFAAKLASSALDAKLKNSDTTLYQVLLSENAITNYSTLKPSPVATGTTIRSYEEMQNVFQRMHSNLQYSATLDTSGLSLETIKEWLDLIVNTSSSDVWGWNIVSTYSSDKNYPSKVAVKWLYTDGYEVAYSYLYPSSSPSLSTKNLAIKKEVDAFLANHISIGMTNQEKIKAVHDYLVKTTQYDTLLVDNPIINAENASDSYSAYGVLVNHVGVCDGYAKAFTMFMDILGVPSERVVGSSYYNKKAVNHAWNRVYVNGQYLNIDVTWDDPVPDRGENIRYDYYLITDKELAKDHNWEASQFNTNYY